MCQKIYFISKGILAFFTFAVSEYKMSVGLYVLYHTCECAALVNELMPLVPAIYTAQIECMQSGKITLLHHLQATAEALQHTLKHPYARHFLAGYDAQRCGVRCIAEKTGLVHVDTHSHHRALHLLSLQVVLNEHPAYLAVGIIHVIGPLDAESIPGSRHERGEILFQAHTYAQRHGFGESKHAVGLKCRRAYLKAEDEVLAPF